MLAMLLSLTLGSPVPTAAEVLLRDPTPNELTRLLLAQAPSQTEEEKNLEGDMDRARKHLGHDKASTDEEPSATTAPPPPVPTDDDQDQPRKKKKNRRAEQGTKYRAMSDDGHGKAYYLVWGIVDWNLAGGFWVTAAILTVYGLAAMSVRDNSNCLDSTRQTDLIVCNRDNRNLRNAGVVMTSLGVLFGAGGGIAAWRATSNIGNYRDLRDEERAHRDSGR